MFVEMIEKRQGYKVACLEEIALRNKWLTINDIKKISSSMPINSYGKYIDELLTEKGIDL